MSSASFTPLVSRKTRAEKDSWERSVSFLRSSIRSRFSMTLFHSDRASWAVMSRCSKASARASALSPIERR